MKNGFTLIEMLVVVGIGVMMAVVSISLYGNLQISAQLNENTAQIIQTLRIARERSIAGYNNRAHGVYLVINPSGSDRYILYQGINYNTRAADFDQVQVLDSALSLGVSDFKMSGSDVDINFSPSSGWPSATGTIILTHSSQGSRSIKINNLGIVEQN
ncbi:MAG: prepilin-type N-terminal cleavage/methylation domain-containing protein [Candidatus Falkowbacteria bacterium]|nr:prepilin-type N-terminal cleavage/methylation domain-containing protein [Candidatus Falkowbacteria bacterium]